MWRSGELRPLVTKYRVGTYAFNNRNTIVDAGSKALSSEGRPDGGFGFVLETPASRVVRGDEEHGYVELAGGDDLVLGQQVHIVPNHVCVAVNLADELVVARAMWSSTAGRSSAGASRCARDRAGH